LKSLSSQKIKEKRESLEYGVWVEQEKIQGLFGDIKNIIGD
jgi:hypothetical protein